MYKDELRDRVLQAINEFFQQEQGNRLSIFSINGLSMHLDSLFQKNKIDDGMKKE